MDIYFNADKCSYEKYFTNEIQPLVLKDDGVT